MQFWMEMSLWARSERGIDLIPSGREWWLESIQASTSSMETSLGSGKEQSQARAMISHSSDCCCSLCSLGFWSEGPCSSSRVCSLEFDILHVPQQEQEERSFFVKASSHLPWKGIGFQNKLIVSKCFALVT